MPLAAPNALTKPLLVLVRQSAFLAAGDFFYHPRPLVNRVCAICPDDTYNEQVSATSCTPRPPRTRGPQDGTSIFGCIRCPEGFMVTKRLSGSSLQCVKCGPGSSTFENQLLCLPCPPGTFHDRFGNGSLPCTPGLFASEMRSTFCPKCPIHTFVNELVLASCKTCPLGTEAPNFGAQQCPPTCQANDPTCLSCPPGSGANRATGKCEECAEGFIGQTRTATECFPCPFSAKANMNRTLCVWQTSRPPQLNGKCDRPNFYL